jgi:two-component system cell cycle sensor histidine kinase/response regulator CckA
VMPEIGGRELADAFAVEHPETSVLFVSGYTDDALVARRVLTDHAHFLAKPFTGDELAGRVREALTAAVSVSPT